VTGTAAVSGDRNTATDPDCSISSANSSSSGCCSGSMLAFSFSKQAPTAAITGAIAEQEQGAEGLQCVTTADEEIRRSGRYRGEHKAVHSCYDVACMCVRWCSNWRRCFILCFVRSCTHSCRDPWLIAGTTTSSLLVAVLVGAMFWHQASRLILLQHRAPSHLSPPPSLPPPLPPRFLLISPSPP
jgi:hypothetical protein